MIRNFRSSVSRLAVGALAIAALLACAASVDASPVVLSDAGLNTSVTVDTTTQDGVSSWNVDGIEQLGQMWYWTRIGSSGPEISIDNLVHDPLGSDLLLLDTNFNLGDDLLRARFTSPGQFELELRISLGAGGIGTGTSSLSQQILVRNISGSTLPFHLFQFVDFNLNSTPGDDTVAITGGNTATQLDTISLMQSENVTTPVPTRFEVNESSVLLGKLNNGTATTLTNSAGPFAGTDSAFAYQWSANIPTNGTLLINSGQSIFPVPEPSSFGLLAMGGTLAACWYGVRRRRAAN